MQVGEKSTLGDPLPGITYVKYFADIGIAEGSGQVYPGPWGPYELEMEITVNPHWGRYAFFDGVGTPHVAVRTRNGSRLWAQEEYVYRQEMKRSLGAMIERLGLMKALPRAPKEAHDIHPKPEDFGLAASTQPRQFSLPNRDSETGAFAMTWNVSFDGTPKAVIDQLEKYNHLPKPMTKMLVDCLEAFPASEQVMLDTHGNLDADEGFGSAFIKLSIFKERKGE